MKRTLSLIAALVLAMALTACANTATGPDMAPGYDNTYGTYGNAYGYGSYNGNGYTGNVSTTPNGYVNGTNRTGTARTTTGGTRRTTGMNRTTGTTRTTTTNTNAMGAGMRG